MSPLLPLVLAWAAGMGLGLFYFGGLWLTVRQLPRSGSPGLLLLVSFVGRTALALAAFYLIMGGRWERMLACLVGFLIMRTILLARLRPEQLRGAGPDEERAQP